MAMPRVAWRLNAQSLRIISTQKSHLRPEKNCAMIAHGMRDISLCWESFLGGEKMLAVASKFFALPWSKAEKFLILEKNLSGYVPPPLELVGAVRD
jgi:hypothetical protein